MITSQRTLRGVVANTLRVLVIFDAVALLFAGIVHLVGAHIPLGAAIFDEPAILPAGIVESSAGLFFVWAAYAVFAGRSSAWTATLVAHLFAIAGFLLGLYSTRLGTTPFNSLYQTFRLRAPACRHGGERWAAVRRQCVTFKRPFAILSA